MTVKHLIRLSRNIRDAIYFIFQLLFFMKKYEIVTVMDANFSATDIKTANAEVEKRLGKSVLDTDEIGLMPTMYPIAGQDQAYYVSYYVEMEWDFTELKNDLKLIKWLERFTFFALWANEKFLKMWELTKKWEDMQPEEEPVVEEEEEQEEEQKEEQEEQEL